MTKESLQNLFVFTLFLWGCASLFGSTIPNNPTIYIAPETVITGIDSVHFSNHSNEANSTNVNAASKAIIYISPNTIFTAPEEVMRQVVVVYNNKSKSSKTNLIAKPETKKTIVASKAIIKEIKIPNPFQDEPYQNSKRNGDLVSMVVWSGTNPSPVVTVVFSAPKFDFLILRKQRLSPLFLYLSAFRVNTYSSYQTTRPPPIV